MTEKVVLFAVGEAGKFVVSSTLDWAKQHKNAKGYEKVADILITLLQSKEDKLQTSLDEIKETAKQIKQSTQDIKDQLTNLTTTFLTVTEITTQEETVRDVEKLVTKTASAFEESVIQKPSSEEISKANLIRGLETGRDLGVCLATMHERLMSASLGSTQKRGLWDNYLYWSNTKLEDRQQNYGVKSFNNDLNTRFLGYVTLLQQATVLYAWATCYDKSANLVKGDLPAVVRNIMNIAKQRVEQWNKKLEDYFNARPGIQFLLREIHAQVEEQKSPISLILVSTNAKVLVPWDKNQRLREEQRVWPNLNQSWRFEYNAKTENWKLKGRYSFRLFDTPAVSLNDDADVSTDGTAGLFKIIPQSQSGSSGRPNGYNSNGFRLDIKVTILSANGKSPLGQPDWYLDYACGSWPLGLKMVVDDAARQYATANAIPRYQEPHDYREMNPSMVDGKPWGKIAFASVTTGLDIVSTSSSPIQTTLAFAPREHKSDRTVFCNYAGMEYFPWRMAVTSADVWGPHNPQYTLVKPDEQKKFSAASGWVTLGVYDVPQLVGKTQEEGRQLLVPDAGSFFSFRDDWVQGSNTALCFLRLYVCDGTDEDGSEGGMRAALHKHMGANPTAQIKVPWGNRGDLMEQNVRSESACGIHVHIFSVVEGDGTKTARFHLSKS